MAKVENWVAENTRTVGTGVLILEGAVENFITFDQAGLTGEVWYSITNGAKYEAGIGTRDGVNLYRDNVHSTFENGVYNSSDPVPINLVGTSIITCSHNARAFTESKDHEASKGNPHGTGWGDLVDKPGSFPPDTHEHVETDISNLDKYTKSEVDTLVTAKEDYLDIPSTNGKVLSSTTAGIRSWVELPSLGQQERIWFGDTAPTDKALFNTWVNTTTGMKYTWYTDDDSSQWISSNRLLELSSRVNVGSVDWGDVTGDIANQTDLQNTLALKSDTTHNHDTVYADISHVHIEADITDIDKYTVAEADSLLALKSNTNHLHNGVYEGVLGNPASDDYVLSSKVDGTRVWVEQSTGGSTAPPDGSITTVKLADNAVTESKLDALSMQQAGLMPTAWVSVNSVGGIIGSYNVLTVQANGTGIWQVNFTEALDANTYAAVVTSSNYTSYISNRSVSDIEVTLIDWNDVPKDAAFNIVIFGGRT